MCFIVFHIIFIIAVLVFLVVMSIFALKKFITHYVYKARRKNLQLNELEKMKIEDL